MIVMPSNNTGFMAGYIAGKYPGKFGLLISPDGWRRPPEVTPYALDNGAYGAWVNKHSWDEKGFYAMLEQATQHHRPLWVACPDKVADRGATLDLWPSHSQRIRDLGFVPAFVAQDGMIPDDVPGNAELVFIGGSTKWKWQNVRAFAHACPRVHVGRVNSYEGLWICHDLGVESCDGTGWMRGGMKRLEPLLRYLDETKTKRRQPCLPGT